MSAVDPAGNVTPAMPIFQQLLGPAFATLPPSVQRLHLRMGKTTYTGDVGVERGTGLLSRLCAWATRLPPGGHGPVFVVIDATPSEERWARHIGGHAMRSRLWAADGLLHERLGLVTFAFRLDVDAGRLTWHVARVRALGVPLPSRAFHGVSARESEVDGCYAFEVTAALPWIGQLVHYRGQLHVAPD